VALNKVDSALYLLHEVLVARKYKTWSLTYERVCLYYLGLCVKEGKFREMKDGLHQYRNMTQVAAPNSLKKVCEELVHMSKVRRSKGRKAGRRAGEKQQQHTDEAIQEELFSALASLASSSLSLRSSPLDSLLRSSPISNILSSRFFATS